MALGQSRKVGPFHIDAWRRSVSDKLREGLANWLGERLRPGMDRYYQAEQLMWVLKNELFAAVAPAGAWEVGRAVMGATFDFREEGYVCAALHRVPIAGCMDCDRATPAGKEAR
jgi:hypothetical protein